MALLLAAAIGALLAGPAPAEASTTVHLPTEADAATFAPGAETVLFGPQGVETQLPGPVADVEDVRVSLGPEGSVLRVEVVQRLSITGLGDFSFKVPGPALTVEALAESASEPGLRRGAVLWQGFSAGEKLLAARLELHPELEADRLPVRFSLAAAVGGVPVALGDRLTGPFEIRLTVENNSSFPLTVARGRGDPSELAPILDAVAEALRDGRRPHPGEGAIPAEVTAHGTVAQERLSVEAPVRVAGRLVLPSGRATEVTADMGSVSAGTGDTSVSFDAILGGGRPSAIEIRISGRAAGLGLPRLEMTAAPALPDPDLVRPPAERSWEAALAKDPEVLDGADMLRRLVDVLWSVARLRQFDAYLGNPDPTGPARTAYSFGLVMTPAVTAPRSGPPVGQAVNVAGVAMWIVLVLVLLTALALAWAHA